MTSRACPRFWVLAVVLGCTAGCKESAEDEAKAARAEERMNLVSNPSLYLRGFDRQYAGDDGGSDAQLTALSVSNSSHFSVNELQGDVIWLDDQDRRVGSTSFVLHGSIPPNGARHFSTSDGTMTSTRAHGSVANVQIVFTRVKVPTNE